MRHGQDLDPAPRGDRTRWLVAAAAVAAVALALRAGHLASLRAGFHGTDLFSLPVGDAAYHWQEAQDILDRDFWLRDRVPWKGPGYSYFLAGLMAVCGRSLARMRWVFAAIGALNCGGLVFLARRALTLRWSVVAGLLAAGNGLLIVYDVEPFFPVLLVALNLPALLLLTREHAGLAAHAGAGILIGLACLVHPVYLLPAALLSFWLFGRGPLQALSFALAVAAAIAPVAIENRFVRGEPVLISWNGGVNVYVANHPAFDQLAGNGTNAWKRVLETPPDAGIERVSERDRLYYRLAWRQALDYPKETFAGIAAKAAIFLSPTEISNNFRIYDLRERSLVAAATLGRAGPLWWPLGLVGPAAILGLGLLLRRRSPFAAAVGLWSLGILVSVLLSFNTARYRAPAVFFASVFAAAAIGWAWERWTRRELRRLAAGALAWLALGIAMAAVAKPQRILPPPSELHQAEALTPRGPFEEVERWIARAVDRDPRSPQVLFSAAELFDRWGRPGRSRDMLARALALPDLEPDMADLLHETMASASLAEGRLDDARAELQAAIAVGADAATWHGYPFYAMGLGPMRACRLRLELAGLEIRRGDPAAARFEIDEVRRSCPDSPVFLERIADLTRQLGAPAER